MDSIHYINPAYKDYDNVEEFLKKGNEEYHHFNSRLLQFEDLEVQTNVLIIGEPGIGKSELLRRHFDYLDKKKIPVCILDLKMLKFYSNPERDLDNFFEVAIDQINRSQNYADKLNLVVNNFVLTDKKKRTLILDGLDEIDSEYFDVIFKETIKLNNKYDNLNIIVSCRSHYVKKYEILFSNTKFGVISILPFTYSQIGEFLQDILDFDTFHKAFKNHSLISFWGKNTFLNTPRYLKYFKELINTIGLEKTIGLSRYEIIEKVIYYRIEGEVNRLKLKRKNGSYNIELIIQVLEKVALVLEIQESNIISKEDFSQFFLDSNLSLHNEISLTQLQQNTILKDLDKNIQFENTEFQEYLAAKQISRTSKYEQIFYDLTIDENINEFKHRWLNVLTYLVEMKPEFLLPIIKLGKKNDDSNLFQVLRFIKEENINDDTKTSIFEIIWEYFNKHKLWIDIDIDKFVSNFGKNSILEISGSILKNSALNQSNYVEVGNALIVISRLFEENMVDKDDVLKIKSNLINYLTTELSFREIVCRYGMKCLIELLRKDEIELATRYYGKLSHSVSNEIVNGLARKYPNEEFTINIIIKDIISERTSKGAYMLKEVDSPNSIAYLLKIILNDINLGRKVINKFTELASKPLLKNIEACWNSEIEQIISQILLEMCKRYHYSFTNKHSFLYYLINIFLEKTIIPVEDIYMKLKNVAEDKCDLYTVVSILCNKSNYKKIINQIMLEDKESISFFFFYLNHLNREIYQYLKNEDSDLVNSYEKSLKKSIEEPRELNQRQENYSEKVYKEYFDSLSKEHIHILVDYERDKNHLDKFISYLDKLKIRNFILSGIFETLDVLKEQEYFDYSLKVLKDLNLPNTKELLSKHRSKLLQCIIVHRDYEYIEFLLDKINGHEIINLKKYFKDNRDDFNDSQFRNFYKFLNRTDYKVEEIDLKEIILNSNKDYSLRLIALELYIKNSYELSFLEDVLSEYGVQIRSVDLNCLFAYEVNKFLVMKNSKKAVKWLIDNILCNKYEFKKDENSTHVLRAVNSKEDVGANIKHIDSPNFIDDLLGLISKGINLLEENHKYFEFVNKEIWSNFVNYCEHIELSEREYVNLRSKLKNILEDNKDIFGVNWFKNKADEILLNLKDKVSKQKVNISNTIQKWDGIMKKKYLNISYPSEVVDIIKEIIERDVTEGIEKGHYSYLFSNQSKTKNEDFYEKFLMKEIELYLLRKGLRKNDVQQIDPKIFRQIQGENNKRTDLLISYGLIGSVLIELKKEENTIHQKYKDEILKSYMQITGADYCICLIINDKMKKSDFDKMIKRYKEDLEDNIYSVVAIDFTTYELIETINKKKNNPKVK
ncbi:MAG: NACHT domain-containing protein [Chitinophagales bacterium]|nr:NACHT domain-containing protein [Chitinophagales bacterium]